MRQRRILVLGGARSGKSTWAEKLAAECGSPVLYVATATATDAEMTERIRLHQARRPSDWRTIESPATLVRPLVEQRADARTVLVEDLTLLLSNLMLDRPVSAAEGAVKAEVDGLLRAPVHLVVVSNEVGMGIVPATALGREFRDALGRINQHAAAVFEEVYLLVAGLPLRLK